MSTKFIFNPNEVKEFNGTEILPKGQYTAQIIDADIAKTKNGDEYIKLVWQILDDNFKNKRLYTNLYVNNRNEDYRSKQLGYLVRICKVMNIGEEFTDLTALYNKPCIIYVVIHEKDDYVYNDIIKYFPCKQIEDNNTDIEDIPF